MRSPRPRYPARSGTGSPPALASLPTGLNTVARLLSVASPGDARSRGSLVPIAFTLLVTGIGLSCVLANVLDGHPTVFILP